MRFDPTQVPTFPVEIGGELPASTVYVPGISLRDLGGVFPPLVAQSLATIAGSSYGPALTSNSTGADSSTGAQVVTGNYLGNIGQEITIFWAGDQNAAASTAGSEIFGIEYDANGDVPYHAFALAVDGGGNIQAICGIGTNYYDFTTSQQWSSNSRQTWVASIQIGGSINLYRNGALLGTTSGLPTGTFATTSASTLRLGNYSPNGYSNANNAVAGFYNGIWTPTQIAQFNAEPFAMLRPVRRRTYFVPASSGTDVTVFGASAKAGAGVLTAAISFRPPGASVATAASPLSGVVSAPIAGADAKANAGNVSFAVQTGVTGTTAQSRAGFLTSEISIAAPSATAHLAASSLLPAVEPHLSGASVAALAQPLSTKNNDVYAGVVGATMTMYASPLSVSIVNVSPAIERLLLWGSPYSEDNNVPNTSGTSTYAPALSEILVEAFERCGMRTSELTQEHYLSGRRSMNLVQSAWSNRGINLWKVDLVKVLMPQGQISYPVDADVINVLDTYLRQFDLGMPVNVPPKFSTVAGSDVVTITAPTSSPFAAGFYISINVPVSVGGIVVGGFYEVQSVIDGTTYTIQAASNATATVNQGGVVPVFSTVAGSQNVTVTFPNHGYLPGQSFTAQIPTTVGGVVIGGPYVVTSVPSSDTFVIGVPYPAGATATGAENGGNTAIAQQSLMSQFTQSSDPYDLLLYPLSRNDYAAIPDKLGQGRPTSYWFDRTNPGTINVWPVPDANGPYQLCYYVFRQMQDAMPANGQQGDMPQRFFEAYTAEVAAHLAMKWAPPERAIALKQYAQAAYAEAQAEDREKVSTYWVPEMSGYFRK